MMFNLAASSSAMAVPPAPPAPGAPPRFAPARADATPRARAARMTQPMGSVLGAMQHLSKAIGFDAPAVPIEEMRVLAATEAERLRAAADQPRHERRDLLDDLASRLRVLIGQTTDEAFAPLRDLLSRLGAADTPLAGRWTTALDTLTAFAGDGSASTSNRPATTGQSDTATDGGASGGTPPATRKEFWKR
jgi:Ca-activated chloride channel family protein